MGPAAGVSTRFVQRSGPTPLSTIIHSLEAPRNPPDPKEDDNPAYTVRQEDMNEGSQRAATPFGCLGHQDRRSTQGQNRGRAAGPDHVNARSPGGTVPRLGAVCVE